MESWDIYTQDRKLTGRTHVRGNKLAPDDYHLVVHIWILNSKGEYLIQKRAAHLSWMPNMWATTGGAVISGEDSLQGVIRETKEELGIDINNQDVILLFTQIRGQDISDIYLAKLDYPLSQFQFEKQDMSEIKFASAEEIKSMVVKNEFVNYGEEYFSHLKLN